MRDFNLSALAVREPSITLFLILALVGAGTLAFLKLGRAEDPSFTLKVATVSAVWPGATAEEMQEQVADRLEKRLQELRYYDRVETTARPGIVHMTVTLADSMPPAALPEAFYQLRKKMGDEAINLPRGVIGSVVNDEYSDNYFALFALQGAALPGRELVTEAERQRTRLLDVPGVRKVTLIGEQPQRIYVEISHARLATLGLGAQALLDALATQNALQPAGQFETQAQSVQLRLTGAFDDLEAVRNTPVAAGGRVVRIGDIAEVWRGYLDPPVFRVRHAGAPALMLGVVMREGWNGTTLGVDLAREASRIRAGLPLGLSFVQVSDQSKNIAEAYGEFMVKFVVALTVVMVVSLIALGWRVGIVVACSVPLTLAAVFVIMLATGKAFDRITLGALILSLGLLVDDAIIAIEMMVVKLEEGLDRIEAATFAWHATAAPMLAGTLVTIIGFTPIGFAQSTAGEYAGNIFWIVGASLLISWVVAVYFTPYLGVRLLPRIVPVAGGHQAIYDTPSYRRLRAVIAACVDRRGLVGMAVLVSFVLAGALLGVAVPKQFFPTSDRPELLIEIHLPKGSSISTTQAVVERVEADLAQHGEALSVDSYVGAGAPRFFLALNPELPDPAFAKMVVLTRGDAARETLHAWLDRRIAGGAYPEARVRVLPLLFGPPVPYPVAFRLSGPSPDRLRGLGAEVADAMRAHPDVHDVNADWGERTPVMRLVLDQDRLRLLGLDPSTVARQVQALVSGVTVSQARSGDRTVDVVVRAPLAERGRLGRLGDLTIATAQGGSIPLSSVGRLEPAFDEPLLVRRDREPTLTVRADVRAGVQPPDVTAALMPALAALSRTWPPGYAMTPGGSVEEAGKANAALAPIFPIMVVLMLTVIKVQTRSFRLTGLVFATAPLGLIGAVPALLLTGKPFGFNAILGLIGLAGILMRNTLILVDQIDAEHERGLTGRDAVIEATVRRARPVVLTALAAVLAFLPLSLSSFWGPLAIVLIGGTIVGTALTLFFLPVLYVSFMPRPAPAGPLVAREGHVRVAVSRAH